MNIKDRWNQTTNGQKIVLGLAVAAVVLIVAGAVVG